MAKSKVAPVRTRWTIPKLELAGAALLARLLNHVTCNLRGTINLDETITGSDTPLVCRHVPGEWNPADCASRGCRAPDLVSHPLWWGPQWLTESPQEWPFNECRAPLGPPDRGLRGNVGQLVPKPNPAFLLERYSSLDKLLGVTGWIKRFVNNCRKPQAERNFTPVLSPAERNAALRSLVRVVQAEHFEEECHNNNIRVILAWIPGHSGIHGNEVADSCAKDATISGCDVDVVYTSDLVPLAKKRMFCIWEEQWRKSSSQKDPLDSAADVS
ncbi:pao retrotransposon peptidase domain-containing protein [Phthorimaea operculella]|nr:pao retrotransposon peptidase domain-containing protein [Phthorimaea operculella]